MLRTVFMIGLFALLGLFALKMAFGLLLTWSGLQLVRGGAVTPVRSEATGAIPKSILTGLAVGLFSALLGVGGGLIAIPLLVYVVGLEVTKVAATSLAIVMFSATAGTITYAMSGVDAVSGLPPGTLGYVHVAAALPILAGSILSVRFGTVLNRRLPARRLRALFAVVFFVMGLRQVVISALSLI